MDTGAREPLGRPGLHHGRQATITEPGLEERGGIYFAVVEMTRMPMILADPRQPERPIVFANNAFLDLTGCEQEEIAGRNCHWCSRTCSCRAARTGSSWLSRYVRLTRRRPCC